MSPLLSKPAKLAVQCLITVGVLSYLLHVVPLEDILGVLGSAHPGYVALGFTLQMAMRLPAAIRIKVIADVQNLALSIPTILIILFSTSFYGLLLPGTLAGGASTWLKYVQHGAKAGPALVAIVVNRTTEILTTIIAGASYWVVDRKLAGGAAIVFLCVAAGALLSLYVLLFGRSHYLSILAEHGMQLRVLRENFLYRKLHLFARHLARMRELPRRALVVVLIASVTQDILGAAALYSFAQALDLELDFFAVAWMRAVVHLVVLLPISMSGLGVREGVLVLLTGPQGVAASGAIAWSFLIFAGTLLAALGGGLIEAYALWSGKSAAVARHETDDSV